MPRRQVFASPRFFHWMWLPNNLLGLSSGLLVRGRGWAAGRPLSSFPTFRDHMDSYIENYYSLSATSFGTTPHPTPLSKRDSPHLFSLNICCSLGFPVGISCSRLLPRTAAGYLVYSIFCVLLTAIFFFAITIKKRDAGN